MGEVVNLSRIRKARAKAAAQAEAAANRVKHGRNLAEKRQDRAETSRREALLDGVKREDRKE